MLKSHVASEIRVAAVWAVVNLCQRSEGGHHRIYSPLNAALLVLILRPPGINENVQKMRALGIEKRLKELRDDPNIDVRERVKDALENNFEPLEMGGISNMAGGAGMIVG